MTGLNDNRPSTGSANVGSLHTCLGYMSMRRVIEKFVGICRKRTVLFPKICHRKRCLKIKPQHSDVFALLHFVGIVPSSLHS